MTDSESIFKGDILYRAVWRWHFYAGLFVIPFLFILALTGMLMLISKPVDSFNIRHLTEVSPEGEVLTHKALLETVREHFPHKQVKLYIPSTQSTASARFSLVDAHAHHGGGHHAPGLVAFVNPYTADVLGSMDPTKTLYTPIKNFHGSLYLGDPGDTLIEIAAGLAILMILSGLYMAWPNKRWQKSKVRERSPRARWKNLHRIAGFAIALPLLFFLLSGLAWTNIWGGKFVQAWSSLPGTKFEMPAGTHHEVEQTDNAYDQAQDKEALNHEEMNHSGHHQVPWVLEQTPLPNSNSHHNLNIDKAIEIAKSEGFENFRVHLPNGDKKVWTVSATTIAGDLNKPTRERTIHLDPANGRILADHKFADYPVIGKAMAAFIPLHSGDFGLWNVLLNLVITAIVVFMIASGVLLWWKRRPKNSSGLQPPPSASKKASAGICIIMIIVALAFPLSALALLSIAILDALLFSRMRWLK